MEEKTKKHQLDEYLDIGWSYGRGYQFQQAIDKFQQALKLAKELKDKGKEAEANYQLGHAYKSNNQIQKAMEYFEKALEIAKEQANKELENKAYIGLGHAYKLNNQIHKAIQYYEKALEIANERADKNLEGRADIGLGHAYRLNNQIHKSIEYYEKALEIAKERADKNMETLAYLGLGDADRLNNQIQKAILYYENALEIAKERADKKLETRAYLGLGDAYRLNNQIQKAIEYYEKALEIAKERANKNLEALANIGLGHAYRLKNQIQKAMEYFEKALEIAKERADKNMETHAYLELGEAYRLNKQIPKAIEYYEKALEIAKELADKNMETLTYLELGDAYRLNNQIQKAMKYYEKALEIAKERADKKLETHAYLGLGKAYRLSNQIQKAVEYYEKTLEIAKEKRYQNLARSAMQELSRFKDSVHVSHKTTTIRTPETSDDAQLSNTVNQTSIENENTTDHKVASAEQLLILGRSYQTKGQTEEAIKSYEEAVQIANKTNYNDIKTRGYQHLGNIFAEKFEYKKAIEYYQKARKISPRLEGDDLEINAYHWLGYNHLQAGQYKESIEYYNEVAKIASQLGNKEREINAYLGLGSAFSSKGDFESARKYFSDALTVAEVKNNKSLQKDAYRNLALVHYKTCGYNAAVDLYLKVLEMFHDLGEKKEEWHACLMLGHTFRHLKQHEKAIKYYREALRINKELDDKGMPRNYCEKTEEGIINEWCGYCCCFVGQHQEAITCYERAKEIAKQVGDKYQEYRTNQAIGNTLCNIGNYARANKNYQEALRIAAELGDKHCEGTSCLSLASVCSMDCDYEVAIEWYEKALNIFEREFDDHILKKKALAGLALAWFNLGNTRKAIETVQKAQNIYDEQTGQDYLDVDLTHQHRNPTTGILSLELPGSEAKALQETFHKAEVVKDEWVNLNSVTEKAYNLSKAEKLTNEDFDCLEKHIKEFPVSFVYTHKESSKAPLTENHRKTMTKNVKWSAYRSLLNPKHRGKFGKNNRKFVDEDQQVFNFAKDDVSKNASTKIPARLFEPFASYIKSIGQISCANIRGTCWLVKDMLVITNFHVYMLINTEREKEENRNLPITVSFDYLRPGQTEGVVSIEVDEEDDPQLENSSLDYKFLRLKQHEGIQHRDRLGRIVQNRQLGEGLVKIVGHPEGKEMYEETCVVVSSYSQRLKQRRDKCIDKYKLNSDPGLHMTNDQLLHQFNKEHKNCLPYDTTLFSGASGSPVFDLNGNIVAMHTQGYTLNVGEGKCSLMEFGVYFSAIYEDMKSKNHDVEQLFPNFNLEDMDIDD